jgi:hypothetical protein
MSQVNARPCEVNAIPVQPDFTPPTWWQRLVHGVQRLYARADWTAYVGGDWPERIMQEDVTSIANKADRRDAGFSKPAASNSWFISSVITNYPGGMDCSL